MNSALATVSFLLLTAIPMSAQSKTDAPDPSPASMLLTDFAGGGVGMQWYTQHDTVMGGRSNGTFEVEDGVLKFTGYLNTNGGGFTSIRTRRQAMDLGDFVGIRLRVRGDGRTYSVRLEQDERTRFRSNYRSEFATRKIEGEGWQDVFLPFDSFLPTWRGRKLDRPNIDPAKINLIGVTLADKKDGDFAIELGEMRAYGAFDLAQHRGKNRMLVVAAADASELQLIRQLVALREQSAGCTDRDLVVAVLLGDGPSRVGGRPITKDEAKAIAEAFDLGLSRFSVTLIGNDGSMKLQELAQVPVARLFATIDAMPRRQSEILGRSGD